MQRYFDQSIQALRHRGSRELIFSSHNPAYRNLRDKSNSLTADEAQCQELKERVQDIDSVLSKVVDPSPTYETPATALLRSERADAMAKIITSKRQRSALIREHTLAEAFYEEVNEPSQEEKEKLSELLDEEFTAYYKTLKQTAEAETKTSSQGRDSSEEVVSFTGRNYGTFPAKEEASATITTENERPLSPLSLGYQMLEPRTTLLDSVVTKVTGSVRVAGDRMSNVMRGIGNLRLGRRRESED